MSKDKTDDQNFVILRGELAYDPDLRYTRKGDAACNFKLLTVDRYEKDGEKHESKSYVPCQAWRQQAEAIGALGKGSRVEVKGGIKQRSFEVDGVKQYRTEVTANKVEVLWRSEPEPDAPDKRDRGPAPHDDGDVLPF